ncbi:MAG: hypothetical protein HQL52_13415 [Magnetococcales bacterium]|nr:hypothetical protein [Magnetococcales bacterium]
MVNDQADPHRIIGALSKWLHGTISVELVAYWNPRRRKSYLICGDDTVDKSAILHTTWSVIDSPLPRIRHWRQRDWFFHLWMGAPLEQWDRILIIEKGLGLSVEESNLLMQETLKILHSPLKNALNQADHDQQALPLAAEPLIS